MADSKLWVALKEDRLTQNGDLLVTKGTPGIIHKIEDDGQIYVVFPTAHIHCQLNELVPAGLYDVESAFAHVKDYQNRHYADTGKFQFNIKFHHYDVPQKIKDVWNDYSHPMYERVNDEYNYILERELECFVGVDCDERLNQIFNWMTGYSIAGRSGGYLILEKGKYDVEAAKEEWLEIKDNLQQAIEDKDEHGISLYKDELFAYEDDIIHLAMSIDFIEESIKDAQEGLKEWLKTDEPWENILADLKEYDEEEIEEEEVVMA